MPGKVKHGMAGTAEYKAWRNMHQRCRDQKYPHWDRYGGRGITVCARWHDVAAFYQDMGPRPGPEYSLDRIDNDGNYEPSNCRWATRSEQTRNQNKKPGCSTSRKGVYKYAGREQWRATIWVDGKDRHLGRFNSESEAVVARENAERAWGLKP